MFDLNPLAQNNAWWQHLVMILGAGVIGYIIGYRKSQGILANLEGELGVLDAELNGCRQTQATAVEESPVSVPQEAVPLAAVEMPTVVAAVIEKPDNLKIIEGIGPKIEQLLNKEGISTFRKLSTTPPETILLILRTAGPRFQMHDPGTWPQQAALAADDKWEELSALQAMLDKGRSA